MTKVNTAQLHRIEEAEIKKHGNFYCACCMERGEKVLAVYRGNVRGIGQRKRWAYCEADKQIGLELVQKKHDYQSREREQDYSEGDYQSWMRF